MALTRSTLTIFFVAGLFGLGWVAGRPLRVAPVSVLERGRVLPIAVIQQATGDPLELGSAFALKARTVIFVAATGCESCLGEALDWNRLYALYRGERSFVGLLCGNEAESILAFEKRAKLEFKTYHCDGGTIRSLSAQISPTIYEVGPDRVITFSISGAGASSALERHLQTTR